MPFFLLLGLWLISRHYLGFDGDAILYAGQGLSHLYPDIFRQDIFFAYGSQDDYTIFGSLYARAISLLGLNGASLLVVAVGQGVWFFSSWRLAGLLPAPQKWIFLALLFAIPADYATPFGYAEGVATARILAEGLTLAALTAALAGHPLPAAGMMALAMALHPLMAVWGIVLLALWWALRDSRQGMIALLALAGALAAALAASGTWPRLWTPMDDGWLSLVRERNPAGFLTSWSHADINLLLVNFSILAAAWRLQADGILRRLILAALILGVMVVAASLVGGEGLHNQLLIQAQPVRGLWLVKWMAILAFATFLGPMARCGPWLPLGFAVSWFAQDTLGGVLVVATLLGARKLSGPARLTAAGWVVAGAALAAWAAARIADYCTDERVLSAMEAAGSGFSWEILGVSLALFFARDSVVILGVLLARILSSNSSSEGGGPAKPWRLPLLAAAQMAIGALLLGHTLAQWQPFFAEAPEEGGHLFARHIPADAAVYWDDSNLRQVWFALGRRSYYSVRQSAGILFSRPAAFEMRRRADRLAAIASVDAIWDLRSMLKIDHRQERPTLAGLLQLCEDPRLDFAVIEAAFEGWQAAEWTDPRRGTTWRLYDCRRLRGGEEGGAHARP